MTETRPAVPRDVNRAFWLWIAGLAVSLVVQLLTLPTTDQAIARATAQPGGGPALSSDQLHSIARVGMTVSLGVAVVVVAVLALCGVKMRAGRNWARIVITVATALQVVSLAFSSTHQLVPSVLGSLSGALALGAAILLYYRPETREYFATRPEPATRQ